MTSRNLRPRVRLKAEALWEILDRLNMTQSELARSLGITRGYLSLLVGGRRSPSPAVRRRMQDTLGVEDFDVLFTMEDCSAD